MGGGVFNGGAWLTVEAPRVKAFAERRQLAEIAATLTGDLVRQVVDSRSIRPSTSLRTVLGSPVSGDWFVVDTDIEWTWHLSRSRPGEQQTRQVGSRITTGISRVVAAS